MRGIIKEACEQFDNKWNEEFRQIRKELEEMNENLKAIEKRLDILIDES